MDNYDLSDLPPSDYSENAGEHHPWLTDEQSRRATFSRRSTTASKPEQAELQQLLLTDEEQLSEQKALADFDISLLLNIPDRATFDEPEDPFALLAACQPLTFDDNSQHPSASELGPGLGLFEGFTTEDLTDVIQAEPEWNDVLKPLVQPEQREQPEQSQGESGAKGIFIPESANPVTDTLSDKYSGKRRGLESRDVVVKGIPKPSIEESVEAHLQKPLHKFARLSQKREETEMLPLSRGTATSSQSAAIPKMSVRPHKSTRSQNFDESLWERVKRETEQWIVKCEGAEKRYMCSYPNCSFASTRLGDLKKHIFGHTHISIFKCTHPECGDNRYFRDVAKLRMHEQSYHTFERPHRCSLCGTRLRRLDNYKRHMLNKHDITL